MVADAASIAGGAKGASSRIPEMDGERRAGFVSWFAARNNDDPRTSTSHHAHETPRTGRFDFRRVGSRTAQPSAIANRERRLCRAMMEGTLRSPTPLHHPKLYLDKSSSTTRESQFH